MLPGLRQSGFGPPPISALPAITETKLLLDGRRKEFACHALHSAPESLVVLFVSDRAYVVDDLTLPAGTVTFGHFWAARPYNVYHWMDPTGGTLAHYFNLASDTKINAGHLHWRDLTIDVLVRPGQPPRVLDADELPPDLSAELRATIDSACTTVLSEQAACIEQLETAAEGLWRKAFGKERGRS